MWYKCMESEDYLHALETTGKILLLTPVLVSLILFTGGAQIWGFSLDQGQFFANGLMMSGGFFMLVYAAGLQFRQGLRKAKIKECLNKRLKTN